MGKEQTIKIQLVLLCIAVILIEIAIFLWLPTWQTILITLAVNLIGLAFIMELVDGTEGE